MILLMVEGRMRLHLRQHDVEFRAVEVLEDRFVDRIRWSLFRDEEFDDLEKELFHECLSNKYSAYPAMIAPSGVVFASGSKRTKACPSGRYPPTALNRSTSRQNIDSPSVVGIAGVDGSHAGFDAIDPLKREGSAAKRAICVTDECGSL